MARTATYEKREIDEAIRLVESAKTVQQLRQGQAIYDSGTDRGLDGGHGPD